MAYVVSLVKEIARKRRLIWDLSKADFKKRFVGSYFGVVWMFVQPMVTVLIYFFVFQIGFKNEPPVPGAPYVLWLVPGIVPWFFFSEALNNMTGCLQEYNYLVKKVVFQVEILPLMKLISCLMVHGFLFLFCFWSLCAIDGRRFLHGFRLHIIPLPLLCWLWESAILPVQFKCFLKIWHKSSAFASNLACG